MNKFLLGLCLFAIPSLYAGGTIGGSTGCRMSLEFVETAFDIDNLPKVYADEADFQKAAMLLSRKGTSSVPLMVNGKMIQVRKIQDHVVDEEILNEILPNH